MMNKLAWLKVLAQNRRTILKLTTEAVFGRPVAERETMDAPISLETPLGEESASHLSDLIS